MEKIIKEYYYQHNVGKVKYLVSYHNGEKENTHKDGSPFFDIKCFKNKILFNKFIKDLEKQGYIYK